MTILTIIKALVVGEIMLRTLALIFMIMVGIIGEPLAGPILTGAGTTLGYGEAALVGVDTAGAGTILGDGTVGAGEAMVALAGAEASVGVGTIGAGEAMA